MIGIRVRLTINRMNGIGRMDRIRKQRELIFSLLK
jgi:hypothetical protein